MVWETEIHFETFFVSFFKRYDEMSSKFNVEYIAGGN